LKESDEGKKAVDDALEKLLGSFGEIAGWRTLQAIPQGRELASRFKTQLADVMAQALASSGPLNKGYGLQPVPESGEINQTGEIQEDGLLAPGSKPECAIDVDAENDGLRKAALVQRGSLYEEKLRMVAAQYQGAHGQDPMKPFQLLCYKLLWTFKKSAQQAASGMSSVTLSVGRCYTTTPTFLLPRSTSALL
jgi:hypothetical protein